MVEVGAVGVRLERQWVMVVGLSVLFCPRGVQLGPRTSGVFHKECVITAFVGFSSCNESSGRPC